MADAKVRIDAPSGVVELEGDERFVTAYLDKLLPFIEAGGFGTSLGQDVTNPNDGNNGAGNKKPPRKRRAPKRPPAGSSCRERIVNLRDDAFFKEKRSLSEIVKGLAQKGWVHTSNQVGASLSQMFSNGEIQRTQDGKSFKYFYDRDN